MDRIVFHHDTVLSDIHLLLPNTRHLMARLNRVGQPGMDGPNVCARVVCMCVSVYIYVDICHTMATSLQDVGKQVWRGAFLLADYIYSHASVFRNATVLELGAGTGLTSIIMATAAKRVYSTDVGEDLLSMCQRNATLNKHLLAAEGELKVRQLDWLKDDLCTEEEEEFSWTEEEVADLYDNTSVIIAADVCYDDDLTDGFFRTVYRLCNSMTKPCTIYLSLEKRMNFTLRHMDVSCDAYDYFSHCLRQLEALGDGPRRFTVEPLATSFPQCLQYERIEHLELWKVTSTPTGGRQRGGEDPPAPTPLPRPDPGPGPGPGPGPDPGPDPDPDP
uniref:Methyltransferase-like protein 22 n=1 Tax=Gadus morhua TaxID=8049 RepID=A0A8C5F6F0_GADMO